MENVKENHKIDIKTDGKKIYEIHLEDSFENLMDSMEFLDLPGRKVCIVTESNVAPIYLQEIYKRISQKAAKVVTFSFTAGEANKQLATIEKIYEQLIRNHFDRKDLLVALGGGVVGDMTGFAAATYLRGIDFIQIPTTLLAQVDSSIGGKTGVDFLQYKNMVGAFHQPKLVYINTAALKSLPEREYFSGMGEVIKHGLIKDSGYYQWIKDHKKEIKDRDEQILREMIYRSCLIKGGVVERDPKEQGERALLNFGHTLGHAIEKLKEFQWLHGECVGVGCQLAAMISAGRGEISQDDVKDIKDTFKEFDLWKPVGEIDPEEVVQTTKSDKKMEGNHVKFILLHQIGEAFIDRSVTEEEMRHALEQWN
nr:3-dehydroquinate synthase [uncultured Anaerostipes sp.]